MANKPANSDDQARTNPENDSQGNQQRIIDVGAGVQMGDSVNHLHSAAKGDEDYINGDLHKDDSVQKPEQDKV